MRVLTLPISMLIVAWLSISCATFHERNHQFNYAFARNDIEEAARCIDKLKKPEKKGYRFAYYLDKGVVLHLQDDTETSNLYLEKAFLFGEDYRKTLANEALDATLSPNLSMYYGEAHEHLFVLYYKALNYAIVGNFTSALIEARRLQIRLHQLADRYKSKRAYKQDAFVHNFIGLLYEASGDINNAFIAYRNAYEAYATDYTSLFGLSVPLQLKKDLLRTAYENGFMDLFEQYKQEMSLSYDPTVSSQEGEVIAFWNNGLGPYKTEREYTFFNTEFIDGVFYFRNDDLDVLVPLPLSAAGALKDVDIIRLTLPVYKAQKPVYRSARLLVEEQSTQDFVLGTHLTSIAFQCLRQRTALELTKSLIRAALRTVAQSQDENILKVLGVLGSLTESSDTRYWQTLPDAIYYTRLKLPAGAHTLHFQLSSDETPTFTMRSSQEIEVYSQKIRFLSFSTPEIREVKFLYIGRVILLFFIP